MNTLETLVRMRREHLLKYSIISSEPQNLHIIAKSKYLIEGSTISENELLNNDACIMYNCFPDFSKIKPLEVNVIREENLDSKL